MARAVSSKELQRAVDAMKKNHGNATWAAKQLGIARSTLRDRLAAASRSGIKVPRREIKIDNKTPSLDMDTDGNDRVLTLRSKTVRTLEGALEEGSVDTSIWEVDRWTLNKWDSASKTQSSTGDVSNDELAVTELWHVKVWLKRKTPEQTAVESVLNDLKENSPTVPMHKRIKSRKQASSNRRSLEICIMDPHLGLQCFPPGADQAWSIEDCEEICMWALDGLLNLSESYYPIEEIVFPFGNDFLHVDNMEHSTTRGTNQPEGTSYHYAFKRAIELGIAMVQRMSEVAPVKIYQIPGNHDSQSSFALGNVLWAYFHNDENVTVDASESPYKFHRFGTNLIGYEHGNQINALRLAALMANERPSDWAETSYREWHLGDQHRKGSSKPVTMEEQGVSIEYLPGITPPNKWHRDHSYNYQKRGAMAFVWDYDHGPAARLQVNLNSYTGKPTGEKK